MLAVRPPAAHREIAPGYGPVFQGIGLGFTQISYRQTEKRNRSTGVEVDASAEWVKWSVVLRFMT